MKIGQNEKRVRLGLKKLIKKGGVKMKIRRQIEPKGNKNNETKINLARNKTMFSGYFSRQPLAIPSCLLFTFSLFFIACQRATESHRHEAETSSAQVVTLNEASQNLVELKTAVATSQEYLIPLRAAGRVVFNPRNYAVIVARCPGRVEEVLAYEGDRVQKDQVLLRLYSPEHQALQAEYLQAKEKIARAKGKDMELAERMLNSVVRRLKLLGVSLPELEILEGEGKSEEYLAVRTPLAGSIISRTVDKGEYVETGREFFRVADLSFLWVEINVFEKELGQIQIPGDCEIRVAAYPDKTFRAKVVQLADTMDEATRTFRLRAEVENPELRLKPGMYADVFLLPRVKEKILAVPERAVRRLEGEDAIFIQTGAESFLLRPVKLGRAFGGLVEIVEGLGEGEIYVSEGSLMLKSEWLKKTLEGDTHGHKH